MTRHLPDCMMPDGAEPCKGFTETATERDRLKAINDELLTALEALCDLMPQTRPGNMQSDEYHIWLQADKARTVIAKAQPEPSK